MFSRFLNGRRLLAATALALFTSVPATAQPITYLFTGNGSGSLNGSNFTNANFSFSIDGDISNVALVSPDLYQISGLTAMFSVNGVGSGMFGGAYVFSNQDVDQNGLGFGSETNFDLLDLFPANTPNNYDLTTAFGPLTRSGNDNLFFSQFVDQETSAGNLSFTYVYTATFQATTATMNVVPEPSTFVLLGAGFVLVGVVARRRKTASM